MTQMLKQVQHDVPENDVCFPASGASATGENALWHQPHSPGHRIIIPFGT